jgi:hypothetical protein
MSSKTKQSYDYAEYQRTELEIRYLSQKYRKAHEWLPRLGVEAPELTPEEALKNVRERLAKLRSSRKRLRKLCHSAYMEQARQEPDRRHPMPVTPLPPPPPPETSLSRAGPTRVSAPQPTGKGFDPRTIDWPERTPEIRRIDGVARASGFKPYVWSPTTKSNTIENHFFMSYGNWAEYDDFTGATGIQFFSEIEVQPAWGPFIDSPDGCGFAGILQYTLPEAPWDGALEWSVLQDFEIPGIWADGDYGYFTLLSTGRQSPNGEDFPPSESFAQDFGLDRLSPHLGASGEDFSVGPFYFIDSFHSACPVMQGQKPRIYIGLSIYICARDGTVYLSSQANLACHYAPGFGEGLGYSYIKWP